MKILFPDLFKERRSDKKSDYEINHNEDHDFFSVRKELTFKGIYIRDPNISITLDSS